MMSKKLLIISSILLVSISLTAKVKNRHGRPGTIVTTETSAETSVEDSRRKIGSQSDAPLKSVGSPKVPVILVQFADKKFSSGLGTYINGQGKTVNRECSTEEDAKTVTEFFTKFCNGDESGEDTYYKGAGSYGSIREYFRDQSADRFTPEFVVLGPVTLNNGYAYYGANNSAGNDKNKFTFYYEAIQKIVAEKGIDWTYFDNDGNGTVDMAFFIFAGPGENGDGDEDTLWPQEQQTGGTQGGISFGCYACCNETYRGKPDGIGAFVHELSHALGLPDFYDTNYVAFGMDSWDIMDYGCYCDDGRIPCNMTTYERDFMGWTPLVELTPGVTQTITLYPTSLDGQGYKIVNPANENEYYVIENRQNILWDLKVGLGSDTLKNHGMMVTHVDYKRGRWTNNTVNTDRNHQRMTIIPADGALHSQMFVNSKEQAIEYVQSAAGNLYPGLQQVTALMGEKAYVFTSTGETPHQMNQPLTDITEHEDGTITLTFCGDVTAISSLFANTEENVPVYNIAGIKVGYTTIQYGKPTHLPSPAGLYIVKGQKYVKN